MAYEAILFLQGLSSPLLDVLALLATTGGSALAWVFIASILYWGGKRDESFLAISVLAVSAAAAGALKALIASPRPSSEVVRVIAPETGHSFPSGHATIAGAEMTLFDKLTKHRHLFLFASTALLVGISRLYLGVHFPEDIFWGLVLGVFIGTFAVKYLHELEGRVFGLKLSKKSIATAFLVLALVLAVAGTERVQEKTDLVVYSGLLAGYYLGIMASNSKHVELTRPEHFYSRNLIGLMVLSGLVVLSVQAMSLGRFYGMGLSLLAGLWITFIYPWVLERLNGKVVKGTRLRRTAKPLRMF